MRREIVVLIVLVLGGCGQSAELRAKSKVPLNEVPAAAMKTAREKVPEAKFNNVLKRVDGVYEIQGKNKNGKVVEVEVKEDGEFLRIE